MERITKAQAKSLAVCYGAYRETIAEYKRTGWTPDLCNAVLVWAHGLNAAQEATGITLSRADTLNHFYQSAAEWRKEHQAEYDAWERGVLED